MIKVLFLISIGFVMYSCGGANDEYQDLGSGYAYYYDGSERSFIYKGELSKANNITLDSLIIYPEIIDVRSTKNLIFVKQKPLAYESEFITSVFNVGYPEMLGQSDFNLDSLNFYIIDKNTTKIHGPLSSEEYEHIKHMLNSNGKY